MKNRFLAMVLIVLLFASFSPQVKAVERDTPSFPRVETTIEVRGSIKNENIICSITYINQNGELCKMEYGGEIQKIGKDFVSFSERLVLDKYGQLWENVTNSFKDLRLIDTDVVKLDGGRYLKSNGELWTTYLDGAVHGLVPRFVQADVIDFCSGGEAFVTSDYVAHFKNWRQKELTFENVERVFSDGYGACTFFLTTDKKLYGIGVNSQGCVGNDGGYDEEVVNIPVAGLSVGTTELLLVLYPDFVMDNVVDVYSTAGYREIEQHIYAIDTSGKIWSWGDSSVVIRAEKNENGFWHTDQSAYPEGKAYASPSEVQNGTGLDLYPVRIDADGQVWVCLRELAPEGWGTGNFRWIPVPISDGIYGIEQLPYVYTVPIYSKTGEAVSEWALPEVNQAISERLLPACLSGRDLRKNISRIDFASVAVNLYEKTNGKVSVPSENPFSDTDDINVLKAYSLGIVSGTSKTTFTPNASITRQEAAAMLARTAKLLDLEAKTGESFNDKGSFASWAEESISCVSGLTDPVTGNKVMGGTGNNNFSPLGDYTCEQALITTVRLYHCTVE